MDNTSEQKTENQEKKKIVRGPRLNQKLKIMYLMKILLEETDKDHDLTLNEIVEKHTMSPQSERACTAISRICERLVWIS